MYRHFILATFLGCIGITLVIPSIVFSQTNNPPEILSVTISTSSGGTNVSAIDLVENSSKTIYIHGSVTDVDSCQQIDEVSGTSAWSVVFFRSDVTNTENCSDDNRDCYQVSEQNTNLTNCDNPADTTLDYEMSIPVYYYADATDASSAPDHASTDWTAYVGVIDDNAASDTLTVNAEINTLKALSVTSTIEYGMIDLGTSSPEQTVTLRNTGNDDDLDPIISDTGGWVCTIGSFGPGQVHYNSSSGLGWESGTGLSASPVDMGDLSLLKSSDGTPSTIPVYFTLMLPEGGVAGSCTSTFSIGAG